MTRSALPQRALRRHTTHALVGAALLWPFAILVPAAEAQQPPTLAVPPVPPEPSLPRVAVAPRIATLMASQPNRAALGVGLRTGTRADTLGVEIVDITPDGPAAKAGLTEGMRIEAINGVSLRLSAVDAADPLTADAGYRRLQRVMAELEPGASVELRVVDGTARRRVSVTTVSQADLARTRAVTAVTRVRDLRSVMANRGSLGLDVRSSGNARDTLGVFITAVTLDGPADSAGLIEGERIAAVNGVDVRDPQAGAARVSRMQRELERLAPGDTLTLRVFGGGRYREVRLRAGRGTETGGNRMILRFPGSGEALWRDFTDNQTALYRVY
jgi:predicted metalloprotease with PDZ domain